MNVTVNLEDPMVAILEKIKSDHAGLTSSQAIRVALDYYSKNFCPSCPKLSNAQPANEQPAPAPAPAAQPEPAGKMMWLYRIPAKSIGLSDMCIVPIDGIEEKLKAAGWHGLYWSGGCCYGRMKGWDDEILVGQEHQEGYTEEVKD